MEDWVIFVLGAMFTVVVLPYWLKLHYGNKARGKVKNSDINDDETSKLNDLAALAKDLTTRIKNLEAILDAETPDWRKKYE
jgi:phage shock protein B